MKKQLNIIITTIFLLAACRKDGQLQKGDQVFELQVSVQSLPHPRNLFSIFLDERILADSVRNGGSTASSLSLFSSKPQHIIVRELEAGRILLDSAINFEAGRKYRYQALELEDKPGAKALLLNQKGGSGEPVPKGKSMISFYYKDDPQMPPAVDIFFYEFDTNNYVLKMPAYHQLTLKEGEFSEPVLITVGNLVIELRDHATGALLPGEIPVSEFDPLFGGSYPSNCNSEGGFHETQRITSFNAGDVNYYITNCLYYY